MLDNELWRRFQNGDREAFSMIFLYHYDALCSFGRKYSKDSDFVKDAIQNLFVRLWKNRTGLSEVKSVKSYLFKALQRQMIETIQRDKRLTIDRYEKITNHPAEHSHEDHLIDIQSSYDRDQSLHHAIAGLTKKQQKLLHLKFYEGMDYDRIAETMKISYQSSRNLLHRAIVALRQRLESPSRDILIFYLCLLSL